MMITIQVLKVPAALPEAYWDTFLSFVSAERRAQAARFVHQADAYRSVLGEVLTCVTLSRLTGLRKEEFSFTRNPYGKPCLAPYPEVQFNVSHSGDWVALIAGGKDELGVDVEKIVPIDMQIAERFFSPEENKYLAAKPADQQLHTFYRLWTLKESYIKAVGMGLSMPLDSFAILPQEQQAEDDSSYWRCTQAEYKEQEGQRVRKLKHTEKAKDECDVHDVINAGSKKDHVTPHRFYIQPLDAQHMLAACSASGSLPPKPEMITLDELYIQLVGDSYTG